MPSQMTITSATTQPSIACGPAMADIRSGIVMNGPAPIMLVMLSAVAGSRPKCRTSCGGASDRLDGSARGGVTSVVGLSGLLHRDEDDAIRAAHAVQPRVLGVLQNPDGLDGVRIDSGQSAARSRIEWDVVDDIERRARTVERRRSADLDGNSAVGGP